MRTSVRLTVLAAVAVVGLSACSSASSGGSATAAGGGSSASTSVVSSPPAPTSPAATTTTAGASVQVTTNPCDVLTRAEASALSGVSMPAGVKQPWGSGGAVKCGYHSGSTEAFAIMARAATPAQAQAAWNAEKASLSQQAAPSGVKISASALSGIGDKAEIFVGSVTVNGIKNTMMAVFVLKGSTFLDLGDFALMNAKPATTSALTAQAATSAGRL